MNNQEFYKLFKNSKFAQVAKPLAKKIRKSNTQVPTHQVIYTPKASASRSNYGMKSFLPKQVGHSYIAFNDIDNYKNMPDVEKHSGPHYTQLRWQESGVVLDRPHDKGRPLFAFDSSKTLADANGDNEGLLARIGLQANASSAEMKEWLKSNPGIYAKFKNWMLETNPQLLVSRAPLSLHALLRKFLASDAELSKRLNRFDDLINTDHTGPRSFKRSTQGTAGFSYLQKGRLSNTPNGIKNGTILPGRLVTANGREAAIGGIVASVSQKTAALQNNYISNSPGKHPRQFVLPFKIMEAKLAPNGSVNVDAEGVRTGSWMLNGDWGQQDYVAANPYFKNIMERNKEEDVEDLLRVIHKPRK